MQAVTAETARWMAEEFSTRFAVVIETMAGEKPAVETLALDKPPQNNEDVSKVVEQPFKGAAGRVFVWTKGPDAATVGNAILRAAGMANGEADADTIHSTYLETIGQTFGGLAQAFTARLNKEVTPGKTGAQEGKAFFESALPQELLWFQLNFALGATPATLVLGMESTLAESLTANALATKAEAAKAAVAGSADGGSEDSALPVATFGSSKTFPLLLDVEMPVSVSFGRAQVPLKDVLKLTTGSIVELNRTLAEPVEVIVNNCVIARGEVVVVEGNFGVRIHHVVSRQERLRTLH